MSIPKYLEHPESVYWDTGIQKGTGQARNPGLIYVFDTGKDNAKLVVKVNYQLNMRVSGEKRKTVKVNMIHSGRIGINIETDLNESAGFIKIEESEGGGGT